MNIELLKKSIRLTASALVFIALGVLFAQSMNTFSSGETVSAAQINANFLIAAPEGFIGAFYLSSCPTGWVAADGTNGTPDLRGQFIRGLNNFNSLAGTRADGNQDPNGGARTLGDYQADAFQGHRHGAFGINDFYGNRPGGGATALPGGATAGSQPETGNPVTDTTNGTPRTTDETRVKNVGLIYCMRKNT